MVRTLPEVHSGQVGFTQGLSLRDIVFTLYRRKWMILAVALPIIFVGGFGLLRQTGSFTAAARILVELNEVESPRWNTKVGNVDYDRELSTLFTIAMSVPVVETAAEALQDSIPVIMESTGRVALGEPGMLVGFLFEKMDVSVVGESSILEFRFNSISPRVSMMAVGALRDAFVEYYTYRRRDGTAIEYYNEQIDLVKAEVDSLLVQRTKAMEETGYSSLDDELRYDTGQLADLENKMFVAISVTQALEMEYNNLRAYLDRDPREFPMGQDESRSQALVHWRNIVSKHEDKLNSILSVHTPGSIPAQRQQELLERSLANLAQHERNYVESLHLQLMKARKTEASFRTLVGNLEEKNRRGPSAYQRISLLDTELSSLRKLLENLQGKLGEVRLSEMADERISNLVNLSDPEIREVISGGRTAIYLTLLSILAFALGLVAAFLVDTMDHRVFAPRDIEDHLKLPVFASITRDD